MSRNLEYGRVYTSRIQKPHFSGLGVFDPNKVFFREDPDGKVYVDDKLVKIVKTKDESNLVMIGDKLYKFVTIGDQVWLAENLDMPFAGASYYNGDPGQSFGRMYTGNKIADLQEALYDSGWHVPTIAEFESLIATAGGSSVAGGELKSTTSWNTNNGNDSLGFDGKAGGIYVGGSYNYKGSYGVFWTCVPDGSSKQNRFVLQDANAGVYINSLADSCRVNVRLIKDTDPVTIGGKTYKTAKIGDQIWTIENLDWIAPGMAYNVTTIPDTPSVWYFNYADEEPKEHAGALYNAYAAKYINDNNLIPGWHVPCYGDVQELISNVGGTTGGGVKLRNLTGWVSESSPATNNYRFNAIPAGNRSTTPAFVNLSNYALFYTATIDGTDAYRLNINETKDIAFGKTTAKNGLSIRLVKDTDPVIVGGKTYKTAKIGSQIWTIENLDFVPNGVELKTSGSDVPSTPMCCYYNYTPNDKGLLYNAYTFDAIKQQIPTGWKLPTTYDYETLFTYIGGNTVDNITKLRSTSGWSNTQGTDAYRLSLVPNGNRGTNGAFITPTTCYLWTNTGSTETYNRISINDTSSAGTSSFVKEICYSIRLIKETEPVEIGGRKYKTTKIGNQLWMTENLDYIFEGLNVGGATLQDDIHAWYYNNDPAQSEGLLYNGYAAKYLADHPELLPEGWKVPESSDFGVLQNAVGGANIAGNRLKNPGTMNGINYCDFNGLATGMIRSNGAFTDRNTYLRLWTPNISQSDATAQQFLTLESDKTTATVVSFPNDQTVAYSIRLVKNLSPSDSKGLLSTIVDEGKEDIDEKPIEDEKKTEEVIEEKEIVKEENKR